jgi:Ethanolamine utilization protein EutJ (predicted chaperonin)
MPLLQTTALVTLNLAATPLPAGKAFSKITVAVVDSAGTSLAHDIDGVAATTATFDVSHLAAGAIQVTATALATDGTLLAAAVGTATLTEVPVATFPAPVTLTIALS